MVGSSQGVEGGQGRAGWLVRMRDGGLTVTEGVVRMGGSSVVFRRCRVGRKR